MKTKNEYRNVWRIFTVADYEREERWLNEMAEAGWNFVRKQGCRFVFRRGRPGEYRYRIDLVERNADDFVREEYFNFLTECGNRIVCDRKDFIYLQRPTSQGPFEGSDDNYTRLRVMCKAFDFSVRMTCRLLRIFTAAMLIGMAATAIFPAVEVFSELTIGIACGALIGLTAIWVPILSKLRRRMHRLVDEVGVR